MTEPADDEPAARTARLLRIPADRIGYYGIETVCEWLIARHDQRAARLRVACAELRAAAVQERRALAALARATTPPTEERP